VWTCSSVDHWLSGPGGGAAVERRWKEFVDSLQGGEILLSPPLSGSLPCAAPGPGCMPGAR